MTVPPFVDVACTNQQCGQVGQWRRVSLRVVALGVVEMPQLLCQQCGGHVYRRTGEGDEMAKITVHGGPSNAAADDEQAGELAGPVGPGALPADDGSGVAREHPGTGGQSQPVEGSESAADVGSAARPDSARSTTRSTTRSTAGQRPDGSPDDSPDSAPSTAGQPDSSPDSKPAKRPARKAARKTASKAAGAPAEKAGSGS